MRLGENLQELRREKGISQEQLAEKLEVSRQAISKWESGISVPEIDKLITLSGIFGVSLNALLGVEGDGAAESKSEGAAASGMSDGQMEQLTAVMKEYIAELSRQTAKPPKAKRSRWAPALAGGLAAIITFSLTGWLSSLQDNMNMLRSQVGGLNSSISSVGSRMDGLTREMAGLLEEQGSLFADYGLDVTEADIGGNRLTLKLYATPKTYQPGDRLTFVLDFYEGDSVIVEGELTAALSFEGRTDIPLKDIKTITAKITQGGEVQTQQLHMPTSEVNFLEMYLPVVDARFSGTNAIKSHSQGKIELDGKIELQWFGKETVAQPVSGKAEIMLDGEAVKEIILEVPAIDFGDPEDAKAAFGGEATYYIYLASDIDYGDAREVIVVLTIVDEYGIVYKVPVIRWSINKNGVMEQDHLLWRKVTRTFPFE